MSNLSLDQTIRSVMRDSMNNGDTFIQENEFLRRCTQQGWKAQEVYEHLNNLVAKRELIQEGDRIYTEFAWNAQENLARNIAAIIKEPVQVPRELDKHLDSIRGDFAEEQIEAIRMVMTNNISIILGGAGTGKSTLVSGLLDVCKKVYSSGGGIALCAPTGKAAIRLSNATHHEAYTIHRLLGIGNDRDENAAVAWQYTNLLVVDEGSMLSLDLLNRIMESRANAESKMKVVIIGDPNQLQAVECGNVIPDLVRAGVPYICLKENHRQARQNTALLHNVKYFPVLNELQQDESFVIRECVLKDAQQYIVRTAVEGYRKHEDLQVLSFVNSNTVLSVDALNKEIQRILNPIGPKTKYCKYGNKVFVDGDRVIITQNDWNQKCCNGDVGILHIKPCGYGSALFSVQLPDGREPYWENAVAFQNIDLAYVLTVYKFQGSEADHVILPIAGGFGKSLNRKSLYTAISRAKSKIEIVGDYTAYHRALYSKAHERKSALTEKIKEAA